MPGSPRNSMCAARVEAQGQTWHIGWCLLKLWILSKRHRGVWNLKVLFILVIAEEALDQKVLPEPWRCYCYLHPRVPLFHACWLACSFSFFCFFITFSARSWSLPLWVMVRKLVPVLKWFYHDLPKTIAKTAFGGLFVIYSILIQPIHSSCYQFWP